MARVVARTGPRLSFVSSLEEIMVLHELLHSSDERIRLDASRALASLKRHYRRMAAQIAARMDRPKS